MPSLFSVDILRTWLNMLVAGRTFVNAKQADVHLSQCWLTSGSSVYDCPTQSHYCHYCPRVMITTCYLWLRICCWHQKVGLDYLIKELECVIMHNLWYCWGSPWGGWNCWEVGPALHPVRRWDDHSWLCTTFLRTLRNIQSEAAGQSLQDTDWTTVGV